VTLTPEDAAALGRRTHHLLDKARYLTLATVSASGSPWAAVLEYAWLARPLRFVFGSATVARHSRDIAADPRVSGSLFVAGGTAGLDLAAVDGAQFTGRCSEVAPGEVDQFHGPFSESVFPDPRERAEWILPPSQLRAPAAHRLYLVEVERWWLMDTRTWAQDRIDRRIEVPLATLDTMAHRGVDAP
jgi:uncharacterized protein YhbP (UPF0306 family)